MEIGEIDNIAIHSSLLDKIDLECMTSKCIHNSCCHNEVQLTPDDIATIKTALPKVRHLLPQKLSEFIGNSNFYTVDHCLRMTSNTEERWDTCAFFQNNTCILEQHNSQPAQCKSFPILIENNVIKLSSCNISCLNSESNNSIPAYIILEKEICLLTSDIDKDFYTKLVLKLTKSQADDYIPPDKRTISSTDKYLQTIASHINATSAKEVSEQVKDLRSFDESTYEKLHKQFESGTPTGADEGFIYIEHKNLIDPMYFKLITNLINK